jgi:hypothetical protein
MSDPLLLAREEIFQLMVRYGHGLDRRDAGLLASVFADPFEFDFFEFSGQPAAILSPAAFTENTLMALRNMKTQHQITNPRIEVSGAGAEGLFTMTAFHFRDDMEYVMRGFYEEKFRRVGGAWKIARHKLLKSYCTGNPKLFEPT